MTIPSRTRIGPVPGETLDDLRIIAAGLLADGLDVSKLTNVGRAELRQAIDRILALAEVDMKCGGNHRTEAIKTLTAAAALTAAAEVGVPAQEHILQKPGQQPGLLPNGNTAAAEVGDDNWPNSYARHPKAIADMNNEIMRLKAELAATIERCAQVAEWEGYATVGRQIAAEIRKLKDKT